MASGALNGQVQVAQQRRGHLYVREKHLAGDDIHLPLVEFYPDVRHPKGFGSRRRMAAGMSARRRSMRNAG